MTSDIPDCSPVEPYFTYPIHPIAVPGVPASQHMSSPRQRTETACKILARTVSCIPSGGISYCGEKETHAIFHLLLGGSLPYCLVIFVEISLKKHTVERMEIGKTCCGCFYDGDTVCQQHVSGKRYPSCQHHDAYPVGDPLFHFCHLQKSLQPTETLFVRRKSGGIFAVLKSACGGVGSPLTSLRSGGKKEWDLGVSGGLRMS
jgi:hypothetical protein